MLSCKVLHTTVSYNETHLSVKQNEIKEVTKEEQTLGG